MDTIGRLIPDHPFEKKENPQTYEFLPTYNEHPRPAQHMLGIVGGNEVPYMNRQIQVETESDLRGITRANTRCPQRKHQPLGPDVKQIVRNTPKERVIVPVAHTPLKQNQMWAYPATLAPESFTLETCGRPEKY